MLGLNLILSDQVARSAPLAVSYLGIRASYQKEPHGPRGFNRVHRLDSQVQRSVPIVVLYVQIWPPGKQIAKSDLAA